MSDLPDLSLAHFQLLLALAVFAAAVHAYRKLSPFFCVTWFGAGLAFGYLWTDARPSAEVLLMPVLVIYLSAALAKGLIETRGALAGNHLVHVLLTGFLAGLVALPLEAVCQAQGWPVPRPASRALWGLDPSWLGGPSMDAVWLWACIGLVFYGTYKVLDHIGLSHTWQTPLLFASLPLQVRVIEHLHGLA